MKHKDFAYYQKKMFHNHKMNSFRKMNPRVAYIASEGYIPHCVESNHSKILLTQHIMCKRKKQHKTKRIRLLRCCQKLPIFNN